LSLDIFSEQIKFLSPAKLAFKFSLNPFEWVSCAQGPATVRMVSMNHEPPLPLPIQAPPGHYVQQIVDENGVPTHYILSQHPGPAAAYLPPPYTNGSTAAAGLHQNGYGPAPVPPYYAGGGGLDPTCTVPPPPQQPPPPVSHVPNPAAPAYIHPPQQQHHHHAHHPAYYSPEQQQQHIQQHQQQLTPPQQQQQPPRHLKSQNQRKRFRDPATTVTCYKGKPSGSSSPSLSVQSTPPQSPVKPRGSGGYSSNR